MNLLPILPIPIPGPVIGLHTIYTTTPVDISLHMIGMLYLYSTTAEVFATSLRKDLLLGIGIHLNVRIR